MKKKMFYGATHLIFRNAKNLRNRLTPSEMIFWGKLKEMFPSYHFRRQHSISGYVADFYSHKLKLVIEIDGSIHELESVQKNDEEKESYFTSLSLKVIRFTNDEIKHRVDECLDEIQKFIDNNLSIKNSTN